MLHDDNLIIGLKSEELCTHIQNETSGACFVHEQLVEYFSLPKEEGKALSAVLRTLATAEKTIRIAMFALTYPPIFDALDQAQKRGVEVTILIDSSFKKLTLKQLRFLRNPLLKLYRKNTRYRLHHKFALIDEQTLIMGSANWSEGGFCLNSEDVLILHDLTQKQIKKMRRIWKALETQCIPVLYASSTPEKERQAA